MKIRDLNPLSEIPRAIGGTDLAIPFRAFGSSVGLVYGDSFGRRNGKLEPAVGGEDWRSPVIVWTDRLTDPKAPIKVTGAVKGGSQLWEYPHDNPVFSTVLPTDAIEIDGRIYVWVMVTKGLGNEQWCELRYSDDRGATWDANPGHWEAGRFRRMRIMLTFDRKPGSEWIDIFSTGGLSRDKGMLRWRVRVQDFTNQSKWEAWCFKGQSWQWIVNPSDNEPSDIMPGKKFGEIGFRWIQGNAVISGFEASDYSTFIRVGANTDADWTRAKVYRTATGIPRGGVDTVPRLYGGYVHPDSSFGGGFCVIVSEWAQSGNPYRAMQFHVPNIAPVGALVLDSVESWVPKPEAAPIPEVPLQPLPLPVPPKENPVTQPTQDDVERVVGANETTTNYHVDNPGGRPEPVNLWGAVKAILFEITLWQRQRDRNTLAGQKNVPDTLYGMSNRAASYGQINNEDLAKVLRNQAKIAAALKIEGIEK